MKILGQVKTSLIDFPGRASTILFVGGCNFRCGYCHNPDIVFNTIKPIDNEKIFEFLNKRKKFLDGVCISGGEPTLHDQLYELIKQISELGYEVKLDTNGTNPRILEKLIDENLLEYAAMDIKAPLDKYHVVTGVSIDTKAIEKSIQLLREGNIPYEFRTTVCKEILNKKDILDIMHLIKGSKRYCLQNFRDSGKILSEKNYTSWDKQELEEIRLLAGEYVEEIIIR